MKEKQRSATKQERKRSRDYGTGSIYRQPGTQRWTIQYYVDGKRIKEAPGTTIRAEAQTILNQRLAAIGRGEFVEVLPAKVEKLYRAMVQHYKANGRLRAVRDLGTPLDPADAAKTDKPKPPQGRWQHLGPVFGYMRASRITTSMLEDYVAQRREQGAACATVNRELGALRRCLNLAKRAGKLQSVPHFPMLKEQNTREGFIGDAEFTRLTTATSEFWLKLFLELGFTYGWREGELLGLRVRQINLADDTIRLAPGSTKNKQGREVVMTDRVRELLKVAIEGKGPDDPVLTRDGQPHSPVVDFRWAWQRLTCAVGLGKFTCPRCEAESTQPSKQCSACKKRVRLKYSGLIPHDLRRSAARALRAAGVPESTIMAVGGWKTAAMFRRYAIVDKSDQRAAIRTLEQARAEAAKQNDPKTTLTGSFEGVVVEGPKVEKTQ